jgi:lipopolysaccharide export system protein LptA
VLLALLAYNFWADKMIITETPSGRAIELIGRVRVQATKADITARTGIYYEASKLSILYGNALVKGPDYTISSDTLRYIPKPEYLYLSGKAFLEDRYRTIASRTIEVIGDSSVARGAVEIYLKDKDVRIYGDTGYYDLKEKRGRLIGNPKALIQRRDTMLITGDTFYMLKDTVWAVGNVIVETAGTKAWGDTLSAFEQDTTTPKTEIATLVGACRVQWEGGWATSDTVRLISVDGKVRRMEFVSNAVVHREEGGAVIQVSAASVTALFEESGGISDVYAEHLSSGFYREKRRE